MNARINGELRGPIPSLVLRSPMHSWCMRWLATLMSQAHLWCNQQAKAAIGSHRQGCVKPAALQGSLGIVQGFVWDQIGPTDLQGLVVHLNQGSPAVRILYVPYQLDLTF